MGGMGEEEGGEDAEDGHEEGDAAAHGDLLRFRGIGAEAEDEIADDEGGAGVVASGHGRHQDGDEPREDEEDEYDQYAEQHGGILFKPLRTPATSTIRDRGP